MTNSENNILCFHCSEPVPDGSSLTTEVLGKPQPMCCRGCQEIARTIIEYGYENYYKYRTQHPKKPETLVPENLRKLKHFDLPEIQKKFITPISDNLRETALILDGVVCPACVWVIEKHISTLPGIVDVNVNYSNNRSSIVWDNSRLKLSNILEAVANIGYRAYPYEPGHDQVLAEKERKDQLRRIGLAGLLGVQVMMISVALYIGDWSGIDYSIKKFFHWLSLALTAPVLLYSAQPFYKGAWRNLRQLYPGMDVPVSIGISIAFLGSVWATITNSGEVYYDTTVMFVFFLLIGRYMEFAARRKSIQYIENLNRILPATASRLGPDGSFEDIVSVAELKTDDVILIRAGETVAADGIVIDGRSTVDESLLTGESLPVSKMHGNELIGGSTNIESPLKIRITRIGDDTLLSRIIHLIEHARSEKPAFSQLANKISGWFILGVLIITLLAVWYWWGEGKETWLPITISVLVATCPCALSLATPTAMTMAITTFMKLGIAIVQQNAVEKLSGVTHFIFDKTGTLTFGNLKLDSIFCINEKNEKGFLELAAALEKESEHPIGKAMLAAAGPAKHIAGNIVNHPGQGISGTIKNEHYFIGTKEFINKQTGLNVDEQFLDRDKIGKGTAVILASLHKPLCIFTFSDEIRPQAKQLINCLKQSGIRTILLSGDKQSNVDKISEYLGIDKAYSDLDPDEKLSYLKSLRAPGSVIAMLGDGINDAPVLAASDISIAMGSGTSITKINADMILMNDDLGNLEKAIQASRKTFRIIRQNILWAITYNVLVLPAAFAGLILPWMAAIGMSLSSLLVVGNASRIKV